MTLGADDLVAIRRTADLYAVAVDRGDAELFVTQFTPDGVLLAPRGRFETRDALAGVPPMMKQLYERTFHAVLTQALNGDGDRAAGETYCIARHWSTDSSGQRTCFEMTIRYQDRFERRDGRWLIATRGLVVDATHSYRVDMPRTA